LASYFALSLLISFTSSSGDRGIEPLSLAPAPNHYHIDMYGTRTSVITLAVMRTVL
jgi:hypothetical protein